MVNVALIQYPGSNCDLDALEILRDVVKARTDLVWHKDLTNDDYDAYVLPVDSAMATIFEPARSQPLVPA